MTAKVGSSTVCSQFLLLKEDSVKMTGIFFATGFEEVEALTSVDLLRRAGVPVSMISVTSDLMVKGARGITVETDALIEDIDWKSLDAIVLPGGNPGFSNLSKCELLMAKAEEFAGDKSRLLAAICGAPSILGKRGILKGRTATVYPGMDELLVGAKVSHKSVVRDGNLITSRGVGTAIDFALALVEYYKGAETAKSIAESIVYPGEENDL